MKRLFSLLLLLWCSLTFCGAAADAQSWRLTDDAYSDSLPQIARDNSGRVWVVWLSNANGNFDPCTQTFQGVSWSSTSWLNTDAIDQHCVRIAYDGFNDRLWTVWDSSQQLRGSTYHGGGWTNPTDLLDSNHLLFFSDSTGAHPYRLATNDSGKFYLAWSSGFPDSMGICFRSCIDTLWDTTETAMQAGYIQSWFGTSHYIYGLIANPHGKVIIADSNIGYSLIITSEYGYLNFTYWVADSCWVPEYYNNYAGWSWSVMGGSSGHPASGIALCRIGNGKVLFVYDDILSADSVRLISRNYFDSSFFLDTSLTIQSGTKAVSGSATNGLHPTLAWSDSHSIFLNTYYDTIWSHPPVRISDTSLHNCINPDIVAENDSTVWVCYQNEGDIYVTRTSVPLGVTGMQNSELRIAKPLALKAWPNPASTVIHFSYTLPNTHNSLVSIYDIAGRLVKKIEVSNNQINWNCTDCTGRKVASGVYFARLTSDGQETIKRISIIK